MDALTGLLHAFAVLFSPFIFAAGLCGLVSGVVAGFLPGLSPAGGLALQLPALGVFALEFGEQSPAVFMIAFAYGTLYGRAFATINLIAPQSSEGDPGTRDDRTTLIAAILAGFAITAVAALFFTGRRPAIILSFGPIEISALIIFLLLAGAAFGKGSLAGALAMVALGLLMRVVGTDLETGLPRLTFGLSALAGGLGVLPVALGLFVVANIIDDCTRRTVPAAPAGTVHERPKRNIWLSALFAALAGFVPSNSSTFADTVSSQRSRPSANGLDPASQSRVSDVIRATVLSNIRLSTSLIPLLAFTLVPVDAMTALLRGAIRAQAILTKTVNDFAPIALLTYAALLVLHVVPLGILWRLSATRWRPIRVDVRVIAPLLLVAACLVAWLAHGVAGIVVMFIVGIAGYGMILAGFDRSLLFFAFAVGATLEEDIRRSLLITRGDLTRVVFERPVSAALLIGGVALLVVVRALLRERPERTIATAS